MNKLLQLFKIQDLRNKILIVAFLLLAGVKDATAKCMGRTKNKLTNALAAMEALKKLKTKDNK